MKKIYIICVLSCLSTISIAQQNLTLEQVKKLAIEHNINMRSADNIIEQAQEQKKAAFTNYFPHINATGFGFKSDKDMIKKNINTGDLLPESLLKYIPSDIAAGIPSVIPVNLLDKGIMGGFTAIQPVFMGGQIVNGVKLAKVNVDVSHLKRQTSLNDVTLTAEQYYWQIICLKNKCRTLDAVNDMLKSLEKDVDMGVKAGVTMRNDLLQIQIRENEIASSMIKLQNYLKLSRMVMAQYIGMNGQDLDVSTDIDPSLIPDYPASLKVNHDSVVLCTPEYKLLQKNVEAMTLQRKMEIGKNLPSVGIGVGYNYYDMKEMNNNFCTAFATISIPISDWWGGSHAIKQKRLAEKNATEQLTDNTQLLEIRMQKNWNDVDDAYKQLQLAKKSIDQSRENLRLEKDYYHAGTVTMSDLLNAQQQYQQSCDRYSDAYAELQIKISEYKKSVGM